MIPWLCAHGAALAAALRRFTRHPFAALFEVLVLGIAFSLPAGLFVAVETARGFVGQHASDLEISVFLELGTDARDIDGLRRKLRALPDVRTVTFVARQDAAKNLRNSAGLAELLDVLPENPLPDAFTVKLGTRDASRLAMLKTTIAKWPGVAVVRADSDWARRMQAAIQIAQSATLLVGIVFAIAAVTVTFNTVRLQMLGRRDEVRLSHLIGATDAFIRRSFLWFGALQGLFGGIAAVAIVALALRLLQQPIADFSVAYGTTITLAPAPPGYLAGFLVVATLLGILAAWIAASRHLRAHRI